MACRSELTAAAWFGLPTVALLAGARQHGLGVGLKGTGKVGPTPRGWSVIVRCSHGSRPTEELQHMPLVAGVPSFRLVVDGGGLRAVHRDCCRSLRW